MPADSSTFSASRTARAAEVWVYALASLPYALAGASVLLARVFYRTHGVWPGPDVPPSAHGQPYFWAFLLLWAAQWVVVLPVCPLLLLLLKAYWKRAIGAPLAFFLLGVLVLAFTCISDFIAWFID